MVFKLIAELALVLAFIAGLTPWPSAEGTREVPVTARME